MFKAEPSHRDNEQNEINKFHRVQNLFDKIKSSDLSQVDLTSVIEKLSDVCQKSEYRSESSQKWRVDAYKFLCESGIVGFVRDLVATPRDDYFHEPLYSNILELFDILSSASERSPNIRDAIIEAGLDKIFCRDLKHPGILGKCNINEVEKRNEGSDEIDGYDSEDGDDSVDGGNASDALFTVLYNILRYSPSCKTELRKEGLVDICLKYLKSTISSVKAIALIVLSFAADLDENSEIVQATECNIQFIIQYLLQEALESESRRNEHGYTVEELLESIARLAKNQKNAIEMLKCGLVKTASNILERNVSDSEVKWTLRLLWSLSFLTEGQTEMKSNDKLISSVRAFSKSENADLFGPSKGILWELNLIDCPKKEQDSEQVPLGTSEYSSSSARHIMISYCWAQQPAALQIFERLKKNGKKVWIDVEKMEGDSLEKMAEAVEKSQVVICCFSEDYSNSQACRSEATYAYKQKKKMVFAKVQPDFEPKGWLGLILGAEIYYQLFDDCEFEKYFPKLMKFIEGKRRDTEQYVDEEKIDQTDSITVAVDHRRLSDTQEPDYKQWSERDVLKWVHSLGFDDDVINETKIGDLNGQNLHELRIWQTSAAQFFLSFCKDSLNIQEPKNLIQFSAALRQLK